MPKAQSLEKKLGQPLPKKAIKQREGSRGMKLDYLETWWVKQNANRIFGVGNWDFKPYWKYMKHVPLPDYTNKKGEVKKTGLYTIPGKVIVTIKDKKVTKGDIGSTQYYGAEGKDMAIKGCVSDALKRCFSHFGRQFGLSLYDKGDTTQPRTGGTTATRSYPTQEELMEKHGMDTAQVAPKCQNCQTIMRLIPRKDGSGLFWGCPKWKQGCKFACNVDEVQLDGTITKKQRGRPKQEPMPESESTEEVPADDIPF